MNFIINEREQKLRGGYYTPLDLAAYIARWTLAQKPQQVLEPSCGDGIFIRAIVALGCQEGLACRRRSKSDPPRRSNIDPGMDADQMLVGCGQV
jgi:adenine-specific DNA methylase